MARRLAAFVRLSRLKFLIGGFAGGALGTAVAYFETHAFDAVAFALAQLTITAAHLMTHYANDYFDVAGDARTIRTPYSGGSGVLTEGVLERRIALVAALGCMAASAAGIVALFASQRVPAALLGACIVAFAWSYSAPPMRLCARGLGELDTAIVVAMLVPACAYAAQAGGIDARVLASTLPGACAMIVMMVCVQVPDLAADRATGKRNLVVRLGSRAAARVAFAALGAGIASVVLALRVGAPPSYAAAQVVALVPLGLVSASLRALDAGRPGNAAALAARGVATFATVTVCGALGYLYAALA